MQYILAVAAVKIAFGKATVVHRVEQVGFSHPIRATNANNAFGKTKLPGGVVLKLGERYGIAKQQKRSLND